MRDPRVFPRPGDVLLLPGFGGPEGTLFHVKRVGMGKRGGGRHASRLMVSCRITTAAGAPLPSRGRHYDLSGWLPFMQTAEVIALEGSNVERN